MKNKHVVTFIKIILEKIQQGESNPISILDVLKAIFTQYAPEQNNDQLKDKLKFSFTQRTHGTYIQSESKRIEDIRNGDVTLLDLLREINLHLTNEYKIHKYNLDGHLHGMWIAFFSVYNELGPLMRQFPSDSVLFKAYQDANQFDEAKDDKILNSFLNEVASYVKGSKKFIDLQKFMPSLILSCYDAPRSAIVISFMETVKTDLQARGIIGFDFIKFLETVARSYNLVYVCDSLFNTLDPNKYNDISSRIMAAITLTKLQLDKEQVLKLKESLRHGLREDSQYKHGASMIYLRDDAANFPIVVESVLTTKQFCEAMAKSIALHEIPTLAKSRDYLHSHMALILNLGGGTSLNSTVSDFFAALSTRDSNLIDAKMLEFSLNNLASVDLPVQKNAFTVLINYLRSKEFRSLAQEKKENLRRTILASFAKEYLFDTTTLFPLYDAVVHTFLEHPGLQKEILTLMNTQLVSAACQAKKFAAAMVLARIAPDDEELQVKIKELLYSQLKIDNVYSNGVTFPLQIISAIYPPDIKIAVNLIPMLLESITTDFLIELTNSIINYFKLLPMNEMHILESKLAQEPKLFAISMILKSERTLSAGILNLRDLNSALSLFPPEVIRMADSYRRGAK